jgi:DNA polymerase III alpha subunit
VVSATPAYAELVAASNFSFLYGASRLEELAEATSNKRMTAGTAT